MVKDAAPERGAGPAIMQSAWKQATLLIGLWTGGAGSAVATPSVEPAEAELPSVSIEGIVKRGIMRVRNVRWHNSEQLIGELYEPSWSEKPTAGGTFTRLISLDGSFVEFADRSKFASTSPDGSLLIGHGDSGWSVRSLADGETSVIPEPPDETRDFMSVYEPVWSGDSRFAAIGEIYLPGRPEYEAQITEAGGVPIIRADGHVPTGASWASRITIIDRKDRSATRRIIVKDIAGPMRWGPDNTLFVSQTNFFGGETYTSILRIEEHAQQADEIYRTPGRFQWMVPAVHPDGNMLALVLNVDNRKWSDFQSLILVDARVGEEQRRLTHDLPIIDGDYCWSLDGTEIYARVRNGGLDQIYAIPLDGEPRRLTDGAREHSDMDLSPDGRRLSYQTADGYGRTDIRVLDLRTGEERVVLVVDDPSEDFALGEWSHVRWKSTDGVRPFGFLVLPPDFDRTRQYPMIVDIHGGGMGSRLFLNASVAKGGPLGWHAWAALGYVVLAPDYRSTGDYGPEVIADRYKAGELSLVGDAEDALSGTRYMIGRGFIDSSRVALVGHSAGGARASFLLTRTELFAAAVLNEAVSADPVSNFINLSSGEYVGAYPAGTYRDLFGGDLSEVPDRYKANYMFDHYRNTTPTLILLGNEELGGVAHMHNEVIYSILRQHGVPAKLVKFVEEGHNYSRPESAKLAFQEVRRWLETYMPARK